MAPANARPRSPRAERQRSQDLHPAVARSFVFLVVGIQNREFLISTSAKLKPLRQDDFRAVRRVPDMPQFVPDRIDGQLLDVVEIGGTTVTLSAYMTSPLWSHSSRCWSRRFDDNTSCRAIMPQIETMPTHEEADTRQEKQIKTIAKRYNHLKFMA